MSIREAAALGARMRFRAVMMTSIAFILGLLPLVVGARARRMLSRRAVGTPVFAGMIAASSIGIFLIPMLYVDVPDAARADEGTFRRQDRAALREWVSSRTEGCSLGAGWRRERERAIARRGGVAGGCIARPPSG